jgi:hypothetical protein
MKKYEFTDDFYYEFARVLVDKIDGREYWNGYIDMSFDIVDVMFNACIVAHYDLCKDPEFDGAKIMSSVSPIWWTIEVSVDGEDCDHDFNFDDVREYLEW